MCKFSLLKRKWFHPPLLLYCNHNSVINDVLVADTEEKNASFTDTPPILLPSPLSVCLNPGVEGRGGLRPEEGYRGRVDLLRRSCHLPDCWNVNAVALIIGFCTHRL